MTLDSRFKKRIAVLVGRFQVPELTSGHIWLFEEALQKYDSILVLIGDTKILKNGYKRLDSHDPYQYEIRKAMIEEWAWLSGNSERLAGVHRIEDIGNIPLWNEKLDSMLDFLGIGDYTLVGSRDSFAQTYKGKYPVEILDSPIAGISGTEMRRITYKIVKGRIERGGAISNEFLEGYLYALMEKERLENLSNDGEEKV